MIKQCQNEEEIIALWQEAFGDSREEILYFIHHVRHAVCLMAYEDGEPASMMYLVDCNFGKYVYAACTLKKFRGRRLMTQLLESCDNPLCLIPADDGLVQFYRERGFVYTEKIESLMFDESDEIKEYLLDGYHLTVPIVMKNKE